MKKALLTVHRCLGLTLAGFLVVAGVTGSFLAFYAEFDAFFNPHLFAINESGEPVASPGELIAAVEQFDPRIRVYYLPVMPQPERALVVYVEPRPDPATQRPFDVPFDEVFINPLTAEITGTRMWGECCGTESIMPMMHKLHNRLFLPSSVGRPLWGIVAILWSVLAVIGLVLTWPATRPRVKQWLGSWKPRRGLRVLPQALNLHKATGLWFWIIILPVALSGVTLGLERQVFQPMVQLASALVADPGHLRPAVPAPASDPQVPPGVDEVIANAREYALGVGVDADVSGIWFDHEAASYQIDFGAKSAAGLGGGSLAMLARDGRVSHNALAGHRSLESAAEAARERIHSGRVMGWPGRVLVFLCGWAVALLSLTGVVIWYKRRPARIS